MFVIDFELSRLRPAPYNPRRIDEDSTESLRGSLRTLGIIKPIIATADGTIVAGHQRSNAARDIGLTTVPAYILRTVSIADEIRFNQLHNATDTDECGAVSLAPSTSLGWHEAPHTSIAGNPRSRGTVVRAEICKLILAYGAWGGAVASTDGRVVHGAEYALSCMILRIPCRVFYLSDDMAAFATLAFGREYGTFSYENIPKNTYVQTHAQLKRLRGKLKANKSAMYENLVLPNVDKTMRILDFGAGQLDYAKKLRADGYQLTAWEPYPRTGYHANEDLASELFDALELELTSKGRFDVVVLDYVLNSVNSMQAHGDVLASVNALAKPGALIFFSGRRKAFVRLLLGYKKHAGSKNGRRVEFLDENGFSSLYRVGEWFFQKFHEDDEAEKIAHEHFGSEPLRHRTTSAEWQIMCRKTEDNTEAEDSIVREFSLPLPHGRTLPFADRAVKAWRAAVDKESE